MAALNLSTNGPSITKSYQSIVGSGPPSSPAASSPTYGQWTMLSVSAPLANAFQQGSGVKESVLKVQTTGEGELADLIDEFSDGKVQFAFVKVKDLNTGLPKYALIGWCGEGVPERTKGYFTSHQAAVAKTLHGYHVQITARSDRDLTPEGIVKKISDASGSKYSASATAPSGGPPPKVASKPAFMPTQSQGGGSGFNPLAGSRRNIAPATAAVDEDGWGEDAPQVTRSQLEKVQSAYQPTKVNMRELTSQKEPPRPPIATQAPQEPNPDVVRGAYRPVGKVDIAAIRRQAQVASDDRPNVIKGAYEPVGKVDIAAIKARAQPAGSSSRPPFSGSAASAPAPEMIAPSNPSERLISLPKPKVANRFGSGAGTFTGTKAPSPGEYGLNKPAAPKPLVGASKTFADEGGKTPAQIWAEKKARQSNTRSTGVSSPSAAIGSQSKPLQSQQSGGDGWKSGYAGKTWGAVQTTRTGQSATSIEKQSTSTRDDVEEPEDVPSGGVGAMREMFKDGVGVEHSELGAPPLDTSTKSTEEYSRPQMPSPPPQPRSPTPPTLEADSGSPIRVAMPVSHGQEVEVEDAHEEQFSPPPMPIRSLAKAVSHQDEPEMEEPERHDAARAAGANVAATSFGIDGVAAPSLLTTGTKRALIQYDYKKAEDNELELVEGEYVTNIEMVDDDWWMGQNSMGESGLFPSNYVELADDDTAAEPDPVPQVHEPAQPAASAHRANATALYDYEAAEDNELTFPENAKITNVEFPDNDWWSGEYGGHAGLFPANYVQLDD